MKAIKLNAISVAERAAEVRSSNGRRARVTRWPEQDGPRQPNRASGERKNRTVGPFIATANPIGRGGRKTRSRSGTVKGEGGPVVVAELRNPLADIERR